MTLSQPSPPQPLPESLWGDQWRFGSIPAADIDPMFAGRRIPYLDMPDDRAPLELGLASSVIIPGIVIEGGRRSLHLARWIDEQKPTHLQVMTGGLHAVMLHNQIGDRWILVTFEDEQMRSAGQTFETRKSLAKGLHFLLVQPDDSGMTYSGMWLLRSVSA